MEVVRQEHLYKVDENGFPIKDSTIMPHFLGDELLDDVEDGYILSIIPQGILRPRWNGEEWVEDMSPEELEEFWRKPPVELSEIEKIKISQAEQFETLLMLIGGM